MSFSSVMPLVGSGMWPNASLASQAPSPLTALHSLPQQPSESLPYFLPAVRASCALQRAQKALFLIWLRFFLLKVPNGISPTALRESQDKYPHHSSVLTSQVCKKRVHGSLGPGPNLLSLVPVPSPPLCDLSSAVPQCLV